MPTPTGTISLNDVNIELGRSSGANINMNDSAVRTLAGVGGSGTIISMNDLRGKSSGPTFTPDGTTDVNYPTVIYNYGSTGTSATISASSAVTWIWTRNGSAGSASVANGGSASSITFSLAKTTAVWRLTYWNVNVTVNGVTKYWQVELEVGTPP